MMMTEGEHIFKLMTMRLAGDTTPEETAELERLIQTDPAIRASWDIMCATFSKEDIDNKFRRLDHKPWAPISIKRSGPLRAVLAAAAIAALLAGCIWWLLSPSRTQLSHVTAIQATGGVTLSTTSGQTVDLSHSSGTSSIKGWQAEADSQVLRINSIAEGTSGLNRLTVPPGLTYRVVLPDGSKIWLNSASVLDFPGSFQGSERRIRLKGEAWMEIQANPQQVFVVETEGMTVTVLGTDFNLQAYDPSAIQLSLMYGAVRAEANGRQVTLRPGQQASLQNGNLTTGTFDESVVSSWRNNKYYFQQTTLRNIASVLQRAYEIEVVIDDPEAAEQAFSGLLNQRKPVKVFLDNLQSTTAIRYYFDDKGKLHFK
ncbi:FecR family protein [Chitinophaga deserti]|uniref:FecR family protein n=1 Tax=Chitinophaga deserti TaxID=2164099 RepID=UPI000D6BFAB0|nr:FecR domain-containing protein [Chitinophaga deserti]